jgi:hypothetical protein
MSPDERQGELGDLVSEEFESAMFASPLFDLGDEIHRDVSGVGFGFDLPGQIVAQMLLAPGTAAVGIATSATDGDEAGGQDGTFGLELLLAGLEEAADQGWVLGNFHTVQGRSMPARRLNSITAYQLQGQNRGLRQLFRNEGLRGLSLKNGTAQPPPGEAGQQKREKAQDDWAQSSSSATPWRGKNLGPGLGARRGGGAKSNYVTGLERIN